MIFKNKHDNNEENFWLSATDMMAALSIFFILLFVLVILFLNTSRDEVFTPLDASEATWSGEFASMPYDPDLGDYRETYATEQPDIDVESGAGGETQAPTEEATDTPDNNGYDEGHSPYAAVFVTVVDAETGNTIKKSGIEFELYADKNGIVDHLEVDEEFSKLIFRRCMFEGPGYRIEDCLHDKIGNFLFTCESKEQRDRLLARRGSLVKVVTVPEK